MEVPLLWRADGGSATANTSNNGRATKSTKLRASEPVVHTPAPIHQRRDCVADAFDQHINAALLECGKRVLQWHTVLTLGTQKHGLSR
jgi:hypothetical protein